MKLIYALRTSVLIAIVCTAKFFLNLDVSLPLLLASILAGSTLSFFLYRRRVSAAGFFTGLVGAPIGLALIGKALTPFVIKFSGSIFLYDLFADSTFLFAIGVTVFSLSSWLFLRLPGFATVEMITVIAGTIGIFSSHRNFSFDNPKLLSDIAWSLSLEPLTLLVVSGFLLSLLVLVYSVLVARWEFLQRTSIVAGSANRTRRIVPVVLGLILFGFLGKGLFSYFYSQQLTRTANGVGQETSAGLSPLGFNSAMGSTNQPAAVVRLDGDYPENPFSPMLYLRENALSTLSQNELVIAGGEFDTDLHRVSPSERYNIDPPVAYNRRKLSLSAYLLTTHNLAFAIDYPISISPIKNPNPERFKGAFQAVSLVPTFPLATLENAKVGDPSWNESTRQHYLATHADPRYAELAARIVGNKAISPVMAAFEVAKYLSEKSIYTLKPNHSVPKGADQVAPYLFGDMRGYCVHFAHATVFMLRALGIPSRIGTGYLTDLSKAKDGHILLRMSDRHAWAEVYVDGFGWIPFDTKPTQVESHADSEMDFKLLEELMGMLGNDEMLPKEEELHEPALERPKPFEFPVDSVPWLPVLLGVSAIFVTLKAWIRYSWLFPGSNAKKIFRAYRAVYSVFMDIGETRARGETFTEYQRRLSEQNKSEPLKKLTPLAIQTKFGEKSPVSTSALKAIIKEETAKIRELSFLQRLIAVLNPTSCLTFFYRRWS